MSSNPDEDKKLAHSVMEAEKENVDDGKLVNDAMNNGLSSFMPDMLFEQMVKDFKMAKKIYGETILRQCSCHSSEYVERNIKIPEFRRILQDRIKSKMEELREKGILNKGFAITDKGLKMASLVMYTQELDNLVTKGIFGEKLNSPWKIFMF